MSGFDDRQRGFETAFVRDEELLFRVTARRNKLVGHWAAAKMGLDPQETDAYAKAVIQADFEEAGDGDVIRKLLGDLAAAGIETSESDIQAILAEKADEARRQLSEAP